MPKEKTKVIITHEVTAHDVVTIVKLPGQRPIRKRWVRCDGGALGKFKQDWDEDPRLLGWEPVVEAARTPPDFL